MSTTLLTPNLGLSATKAISFGRSAEKKKINNILKGGETYVITSNSLYFDEYSPKLLTQKGRQKESRKYFTPFRRLSQVCGKLEDNRFTDGCKIITTANKECFDHLAGLTTFPRDKRANFWLPSIVGLEENGEMHLHGKTSYELLSDKIEDGATSKKLIEKFLTSITDKNTSDLVVAVGNAESDLEFLDPFKRLGLNPNKKGSFEQIKDLPFKSAFICNKDTPKSLINKLENLAKKCNADGQLRFIVVRNGVKTQINKIAHSVLLLQKAFASTSEVFCEEITENLRKILQYRHLKYKNKNLFPLFIEQENVEDISFLRRIYRFMKQNKITTALIGCAVVVPLYVKKVYLKDKEK